MNKEFNKGLLLAGAGSFWWGFIGVIYFKSITYIGHIELVVHRCLWSTFTLIYSNNDYQYRRIKKKNYLQI